MSRALRAIAVSATALLTLGLASCGSDDSADSSDSTDTSESDASESGEEEGEQDDAAFEPVTIEHAFGSTTIEEKPERVATVNWANHEVPLALDVVPVGFAAANFADPDGDGMLPWVSEKLDELGADAPVLFDEGDGIDFEAVHETQPDVILAAYSGMDQEEYDTLSQIAPTVAYPETAWGTDWRQMIEYNSQGIGMGAAGEDLIADIEADIASAVAEYPQLEGKTVAFLTHVDPTDLSEITFYSTLDTRVRFFEDLGMEQPDSIQQLSEDADSFSLSISADQAEQLSDIDIIVTYGSIDTIEALSNDPVLSQVPAIANGAIVGVPESDPVGTAANPTPLAIEWVLEDYLSMLAEAADKAQ